jgi:ankyrin repeat protein
VFITGSLAACKIIIDIAGKQCVNDRDSQGRNALHLATIGGHGDVVNYLLDHSGTNCVNSYFYFWEKNHYSFKFTKVVLVHGDKMKDNIL